MNNCCNFNNLLNPDMMREPVIGIHLNILLTIIDLLSFFKRIVMNVIENMNYSNDNIHIVLSRHLSFLMRYCTAV